MSSHREAPEIAKDPTADSTDVYAFVDPLVPSMVTLIANYIPLEGPDGGPNFYEFDDKVGYYINIDNTGTGTPNIAYNFQFTTTNTNPETFLYNTGPITKLNDPNWNRQQTFTLKRLTYAADGVTVTNTVTLGTNLRCPPCNIGPLSTPDYASLVERAIYTVGPGPALAFAGQRAEGFYVDLGSVFDLGNLRPFEQLHEGVQGTGLMSAMPGVNSTDAVNVHTLAVRVPITDVVAGGTTPSGPSAANAVIGVWTSATRPASRVYNPGSGTTGGGTTDMGSGVQVSRLGNPLVNELLISLSQKDAWNALMPVSDSDFLARFQNPELAILLPSLYPGATFQNLQAFNNRTSGNKTRGDIVAILLTGIPSGVIPGFAGNHLAQPGVHADMLRLNVAIAPAAHPSNLGILGGDVAGFPNGRRVFDDVATIELRAVAGATLPLVDPTFTADGAAGAVSFGLTANGADLTAKNTELYDRNFPFLGRPHAGFDAHTARAVTGANSSNY